MTDPGTDRIVVNGLSMSPAMWARVLAAVRGLFLPLTEGLSDPAAVQAVMRTVVTDWLVNWEGQQANPQPVERAVDQLRQSYLVNIDAAQRQARTDAEGDIQPTVAS